MPLLDNETWVASPIDEVTKLAKDLPDGIHELDQKYVVKKVKGQVVGVIRIMDYRGVPDAPAEKSLTRIDSVFVPEEYRRLGYGKELLLWLIKHHDVVESNLTVSPQGEKLWKSIKGTPGIEIRYNDNNEDYGHKAWKKRSRLEASPELYHGSPTQGIEEFVIDKKHSRHELPHEGEGIYLTEDPEIARGYAGPEGSVYTCTLRSGATFDATDPKEFTRCLRLAKEEAGEIRMSPESAKMIRQIIKRAADGDSGITNFGDQVRLILSNDEIACTTEGSDEKISKTRDVIDAYIEEHPIIKYYDSQIGKGEKLIFVVRDASLIHITGEVPVQEL